MDNPTTGEQITSQIEQGTFSCLRCQASFPVEFALFQWGDKTRRVPAQRYCPECTAVLYPLTVGESPQAVRERRFLKLCPEKYRSEWIEANLPRDLIAKVRGFVSKGKGVLLHGERSGSFKTTAALRGAVKYLVYQDISVSVVSALALREEVSAAGQGLEKVIAAAVRPLWLMIDDIGNAAATDTAGEAILRILEERGDKPLILTSQYGKAGLREHFSRFAPKRGEAIVRRISDLCAVIKVP